MSQPWKVLVDHKEVPKPGIDLLKAHNCEVTILENYNADVFRPKILEALKQGFDAVFLASKVKVDKEFLDTAGKKLKVVSTMSSGYDHIDTTLIKERGIKAGHTPEVLSAAVAEMAVLLLLSAARRAHEGRQKMEACERSTGPQWLLGRDIRGSTVGIFGLGNIGQEIVKRLKAFEVGKFIHTGPRKKDKVEKELGVDYVTWDKFLAESDFLVISAPLNDGTRKRFNNNAFDKMKKQPVFVNVARGEIVDTAALERALCTMKIFAAGLDVTDPEPLPPKHKLLTLRNVEIVPHLGSATTRTRNDMAKVAAQNIINGLNNEDLVYAIP
ncbi:glyoxylate reductase/hydroxypyruvate reductase-like [Temnothorax curvispinosus]|uniref:Glyoxylate reductase/hydroxypyruvate reductase n=1 Tax=Temnothorax curvispinosus TaxID=300111 RepID=A0A6J1PD33_9HYME|nr:glyoxylate reductase/hydroxypyruvate reductase-like [Temnothorax curvispinosus]